MKSNFESEFTWDVELVVDVLWEFFAILKEPIFKNKDIEKVLVSCGDHHSSMSSESNPIVHLWYYGHSHFKIIDDS